MAIFFDSTTLDVTTFLCIIGALLYYHLTSTRTFWKRRKVPFIEPHIIYGNFKDVVTFKTASPLKIQEFYNHFKNSGNKFGGIFRFRDPVLLICDSKLAKQIYVKDFEIFSTRGIPYDETFDPLSLNLAFVDGSKWKYLRTKLSPAFSTGKLKSMFGLMKDTVSSFEKVLEKGANENEILDMKELCAQFTTDVIGATAFGLDINSLNDDQSEFRRQGRALFVPSKMEKILHIVRMSFPALYKTLKLRHFPKEATDFFRNLVRETMDHRLKNDIERLDIMHYLIKLQQTKGRHAGVELKDLEEMQGVENAKTNVNENEIELTDDVITAQAFFFFVAGFETTASTLSACFLQLALLPEIQAKLFKEVDTVLKKHGGLTYDAFTELKYTEMVLDETLRKYPTVPLIPRKNVTSYKLPGTDIVLAPGTMILFPAYSFHHDPEYFPDPDEFIPERFSEENKSKIPAGSYMPFGMGPRICLGLRFAMMEMTIALALIISKYKVLPCEKTKPFKTDPRAFVMVPEDGVWVRFQKRN